MSEMGEHKLPKVDAPRTDAMQCVRKLGSSPPICLASGATSGRMIPMVPKEDPHLHGIRGGVKTTAGSFVNALDPRGTLQPEPDRDREVGRSPVVIDEGKGQAADRVRKREKAGDNGDQGRQ